MGFIYKVTAPTGEVYIGQTIGPVNKRWAHHCYNAKYGTTQLVCQKIREHGPESFTVETLKEVDDDDLNYFEEKYITQFNSIFPYGLNLRNGGASRDKDQFRLNNSNARRIYNPENFELPVNMRAVIPDSPARGEASGNGTEIVGFRVDIPGKKAYSFRDSTMTLQEKYDLAIKKYKEVELGQDDPTENRKKKVEGNTLPEYVYWINKAGGARARAEVRIPGRPRKAFGSKKNTKDELLGMAIKYKEDVLAGHIEEKPKVPRTLPEYIYWREDHHKATFKDPRTQKTYNFATGSMSKDELIALAVAKKNEVLNQE
jgi:hypothetical protein